MQYCAAIQGTPDRAGLYSMSIDIEAWATIFTPFNAPFTFEDFSLRVNCPLIDGVDVVNANSLDGTQGTLTVSLAEGVVATEIAWFNSSGLQIGTGESVTVVNPGTFSVMVTTEDCQSEFGGWVVIDQGLDCTMTATVDVTNADEEESNGALVVNVENAEGPWTATWYDGEGFILGTGETLEGLDAGDFSVLVVDSIGCSVEVEDIQVITGLEDIEGEWNANPNPAHDGWSFRDCLWAALGRWSAFKDRLSQKAVAAEVVRTQLRQRVRAACCVQPRLDLQAGTHPTLSAQRAST